MQLTLVNLTDEPLADWWAQVILEDSTTVTDSWGITAFTFDTNVLTIVPPSYEDSPIEARGSVSGTVCLDPYQEPIGFNVFGESAEEGSSGSTEDDLRGELVDAESGWAVRYTEGGSSDSETCYNLLVANLSGEDASRWEAVIRLDGETRITRSWSFNAFTTGDRDTILLLPEEYARELGSGDVVWGGVCMDPAATPMELEVTATP
jgi:hypothetical protein